MEDIAIISSSYLVPRNLPLPSVPGFIVSNFNPLVHACLKNLLPNGKFYTEGSSAILLGSCYGDTTTADTASKNLVQGRHHNPLLFYQSVPTSIVGHVAKEIDMSGHVSCISGFGKTMLPLLEMAATLLTSGGVNEVAVIWVELASDQRVLNAVDQMKLTEQEFIHSEDSATAFHLVKLSEAERLNLPRVAVIEDIYFGGADLEQCFNGLNKNDNCRIEQGGFNATTMSIFDDFFHSHIGIGKQVIVVEQTFMGEWNAISIKNK